MDMGHEEYDDDGYGDQAAIDEEDELLLLEMFKEECWAEVPTYSYTLLCYALNWVAACVLGQEPASLGEPQAVVCWQPCVPSPYTVATPAGFVGIA